MRVAAVVLASLPVLLAVPGCSSSTPPAATASDAGDQYRALGQSCDPATPHPCEVLTDACSVAVCESSVCVRVFVDAGPTCSNGGSPSSYDAGTDAGQGSDAGDAGDAGGDATAPEDAGIDASDAATDASVNASGD